MCYLDTHEVLEPVEHFTGVADPVDKYNDTLVLHGHCYDHSHDGTSHGPPLDSTGPHRAPLLDPMWALWGITQTLQGLELVAEDATKSSPVLILDVDWTSA